LASFIQATSVGANLFEIPTRVCSEKCSYPPSLSLTSASVRTQGYAVLVQGQHTRHGPPLISQPSFGRRPNTTTTFNHDVATIRNRGVEFAWLKTNVLIDRLESCGSVTYSTSVHPNDRLFDTTGTTSRVQTVPNVPTWRTTGGVLDISSHDAWTMTLAAALTDRNLSRDSSITPSHPQLLPCIRSVPGFSIRSSPGDRSVHFSFGSDNIGNEKYHLFPPVSRKGPFVVELGA